MQINTELDAQHYEKLQQLQRTTGKDLRAVLESAIDELYARHKVAVGRDALAILRNNGFIGCMHGDGRLSQDYKQKLDWSHKL
jgi:hypothetical protein